MHSHRLYTFSPADYNQKKIVKHRHVKNKLLYPDLAKLKAPAKEISRQNNEFNR